MSIDNTYNTCRVLYMITLRFGLLRAFDVSYGQELRDLSPQKFVKHVQICFRIFSSTLFLQLSIILSSDN